MLSGVRHGGGGIILTSYGMCTSNAALLAGEDEPPFDVLICDEGHKLKSTTTKLSAALRRVAVTFRLLLTGTPIQNSLDELWALVDFVTQGAVLGDRKLFNKRFGAAIANSQDRRATEVMQEAGAKAMTELMKLLRPLFLRREKGSTLGAAPQGAADTARGAGAGAGAEAGGGAKAAPTPDDDADGAPAAAEDTPKSATKTESPLLVPPVSA